jgi:serine protease Do
LVSAVSEGSPAERAGVERGDVILTVDGQPVSDGNGLRNRIAGTKPGSTVVLGLQRDGKSRTTKVELGELRAANAESTKPGNGEGGRLGLAVRPIAPDEARELGLQGTGGLLVAEVDPSGPAAAAGIRPGDVIEQVNKKPVKDAAELRAAVKASGDVPALVLVSRKDGSLYLTLDPLA